ncbi:MAG: hypothetical protein IPK58_20950 [Acidobacteria bacterium]|nr:hypothetical protein [Acidobacteriota bacterium]
MTAADARFHVNHKTTPSPSNPKSKIANPKSEGLFAECHPVAAFDHLAVLVRHHARAAQMICCQITNLRRRGRIIARQGRVFRHKRSASIIDENGRLGRGNCPEPSGRRDVQNSHQDNLKSNPKSEIQNPKSRGLFAGPKSFV